MLIATGCLGKPSLPAVSDASPPDAVPTCVGQYFGNVAPLHGAAIDGHTVSDPALDRGGLDLWFTNQAGAKDVEMATRETSDSRFDTLVDVSVIASPADTVDPSLTADGLDLFFISTRSADGNAHAWESQRSSRDTPWSPPTLVSLPGAPLAAYGLDVSVDGLTLYYVTGVYELYSATRPARDQAFETTSPLLASDVCWISVSPDQLELYAMRMTGAGTYHRGRTDTSMAFDVTDMLVDPFDDHPDISADGTQLVMADQSNALQVATRACP
jgi:hypothetical protein